MGQPVVVTTATAASPPVVVGQPVQFVGAQVSRGVEWLSSIDALFVRLKIDLFEQITGCEQRNKYHLVPLPLGTNVPERLDHNYTRPLQSAGDALEGLLACKECVESWGWHHFPTLDRAARDRLSSLGVPIFDVRPMTALRPDAHTQHQYAKGKYDCLHLALPGVPDWWSALLLATVELCGL